MYRLRGVAQSSERAGASSSAVRVRASAKATVRALSAAPLLLRRAVVMALQRRGLATDSKSAAPGGTGAGAGTGGDDDFFEEIEALRQLTAERKVNGAAAATAAAIAKATTPAELAAATKPGVKAAQERSLSEGKIVVGADGVRRAGPNYKCNHCGATGAHFARDCTERAANAAKQQRTQRELSAQQNGSGKGSGSSGVSGVNGRTYKNVPLRKLKPHQLALLNAEKVLKAKNAWTSARGQVVGERLRYVMERGRLEDMDVRRFIRNYVQQPARPMVDLQRDDLWELLSQAHVTSKRKGFIKFHAEWLNTMPHMTSVMEHMVMPDDEPIDVLEAEFALAVHMAGDSKQSANDEKKQTKPKNDKTAADAKAADAKAGDAAAPAAQAAQDAAPGAAAGAPAAPADAADAGDADADAAAVSPIIAANRGLSAESDPFLRRGPGEHWMDAVDLTPVQRKFQNGLHPMEDDEEPVHESRLGPGPLKMRRYYFEVRAGLEAKKAAADAAADAKALDDLKAKAAPGAKVDHLPPRLRQQLDATDKRFKDAITAGDKEYPEAARELYLFWTALDEAEKMEFIPFALTREERGLTDLDKQAFDIAESKSTARVAKQLQVLKLPTDKKVLARMRLQRALQAAASLKALFNRRSLSAAEAAGVAGGPGSLDWTQRLALRNREDHENDRAAALLGEPMAVESARDKDFVQTLDERARKIMNIRRIMAGKLPIALADAPIRDTKDVVKALREELELNAQAFGAEEGADWVAWAGGADANGLAAGQGDAQHAMDDADAGEADASDELNAEDDPEALAAAEAEAETEAEAEAEAELSADDADPEKALELAEAKLKAADAEGEGEGEVSAGEQSADEEASDELTAAEGKDESEGDGESDGQRDRPRRRGRDEDEPEDENAVTGPTAVLLKPRSAAGVGEEPRQLQFDVPRQPHNRFLLKPKGKAGAAKLAAANAESDAVAQAERAAAEAEARAEAAAEAAAEAGEAEGSVDEDGYPLEPSDGYDEVTASGSDGESAAAAAAGSAAPAAPTTFAAAANATDAWGDAAADPMKTLQAMRQTGRRLSPEAEAKAQADAKAAAEEKEQAEQAAAAAKKLLFDVRRAEGLLDAEALELVKRKTVAQVAAKLRAGKLKAAIDPDLLDVKLLDRVVAASARDATDRSASEQGLWSSVELLNRRNPSQIALDELSSAGFKKHMKVAERTLEEQKSGIEQLHLGPDEYPANAAAWEKVSWTLPAVGKRALYDPDGDAKASKREGGDAEELAIDEMLNPDVTITPPYVANQSKVHSSVIPWWSNPLPLGEGVEDEENVGVLHRSDHTGKAHSASNDHDEMLHDDLWDRDPLYEHRQGMDYDFLQQLDPYAHRMEELPTEKELYESLKFMYVTNDVMEAMFALHYRDPQKYHPRYLSRMFNLGLPRTHAILRIKHSEKKLLATRDAHKPPVSDKVPFADPRFTAQMRQNLYRAVQDPENKLHVERAENYFWSRVSFSAAPNAYAALQHATRKLERDLLAGNIPAQAPAPEEVLADAMKIDPDAVEAAQQPTADEDDDAFLEAQGKAEDAKAEAIEKAAAQPYDAAKAAAPGAPAAADDNAGLDALEADEWLPLRDQADRYTALIRSKLNAINAVDLSGTAAGAALPGETAEQRNARLTRKRNVIDARKRVLQAVGAAYTDDLAENTPVPAPSAEASKNDTTTLAGRMFGTSSDPLFRFYQSDAEAQVHAREPNQEKRIGMLEAAATRDAAHRDGTDVSNDPEHDFYDEDVDPDVENSEDFKEGAQGVNFRSDVLYPELQAGRFFAFDPPNMQIAGRNQRQHFLNDYDAYHFERAEKKRADLFLDRQATLGQRESHLLGKYGPLGSDLPPPKPPVLLEKGKGKKGMGARHHWVFTDLKSKKDAQYEIVVRDKSGDLRTLSHSEYVQMRKSTAPLISGSPFTYTNKPAGGYWMTDAERAAWSVSQEDARKKAVALSRVEFLTRKQVERGLEWKQYMEARAAKGDARCRGSLLRARVFPESSEYAEYASKQPYAWETEYRDSPNGKQLLERIDGERKNANWKRDRSHARAQRLAERAARDRQRYATELAARDAAAAEERAVESKLDSALKRIGAEYDVVQRAREATEMTELVKAVDRYAKEHPEAPYPTVDPEEGIDSAVTERLLTSPSLRDTAEDADADAPNARANVDPDAPLKRPVAVAASPASSTAPVA